NAIKFGLYDTTGPAIIRIGASVKNGSLVIEVCNPFDTESAVSGTGTGFGLSSIQRRLYLLFARNDLLITSAVKNIFTTIVKIPRNDNQYTDR
ncbi:MAG: sensor histidine kinase, partial [Flavitalea sp.]